MFWPINKREGKIMKFPFYYTSFWFDLIFFNSIIYRLGFSGLSELLFSFVECAGQSFYTRQSFYTNTFLTTAALRDKAAPMRLPQRWRGRSPRRSVHGASPHRARFSPPETVWNYPRPCPCPTELSTDPPPTPKLTQFNRLAISNDRPDTIHTLAAQKFKLKSW